MDIKTLEGLLIKHGAVIRAVPFKIRSTIEKKHATGAPNETIKYLPEYKREMLIKYEYPKSGGKLLLTFAKHTGNDIVFTKWKYFNSLEEIIDYLSQLSDGSDTDV